MPFVYIFLVNALGYALLYASYSYAVKTLAGRVVWVIASVVGMLIGSTIGEKLFRK